MILDETDYIQHFGVPGMKWGRRKNRETSETRQPTSSKDKSFASRHKKALIGGGVAVGVAVTAALLIRHGNKEVRSIPPRPFFEASGPRGSMRVGSAINGTALYPETLNLLVSSLRGG